MGLLYDGLRMAEMAARANQRATRAQGPPSPDAVEARRQEMLAQAQQRRVQRADIGQTVTAATGTVAVREGTVLEGTTREGRPAIDGAETLAYARIFLGHFCVWPSEAALTAATLWAAHCHARGADKRLVFLSTPRLLFSSGEPGSGKSAAMTVVSRLCPDPVMFTEPSEPAVVHSIGEHRTIALDEVDVLFGNGNRKAAIRAVINDGYTPLGEWPRVRNGVVHRIPTFGPLMMAGLDKVDSGTSGTMAATMSRCIRIKMRKAPADWRAPRMDDQAQFAASVISERIGMWASQELDTIAAHVPEMDGIGLRQAQLFEPLFTMADMAGGPWPMAARDAADELITTGGMAAEQDDSKLDRLEDILAGWDKED